MFDGTETENTISYNEQEVFDMKNIAEKITDMVKNYGKEKMNRMQVVKEAIEKSSIYYFVG